MFRQNFAEAAKWLETQGENLAKNERAYKIAGAQSVYMLLTDYLAGNMREKVNVQPPKHLNLLGWQILDGLNTMANESPEAFRAALQVIWEQPISAANADRFWSELDPALDKLTDKQRKHFSGEGTRASVASYFLFLADPIHQPFYRPNFGGKAINWLYGTKDGLDRRTLGTLLTDYTGRCRYLKSEFNDAGVPLEDMIDVQSALYILADQYLEISRKKRG